MVQTRSGDTGQGSVKDGGKEKDWPVVGEGGGQLPR